MSAQYPQVFEPQLDAILAGTMTEPEQLKTILRQLLVTRRRYNDPNQVAGLTMRSENPFGPSLGGGSSGYTVGPLVATGVSNTGADRLGGTPFSNFWSIASQKVRVEQGITFLTPLVGAAVGDYPPIQRLPNGTVPDSTHDRIDSMGNYVPAGKP